MVITNGPEPVYKNDVLEYHFFQIRPNKFFCEIYPQGCSPPGSTKRYPFGRAVQDTPPGETIHVKKL